MAAHAHDYPDLGEITYEHRDPYENWSDIRFRRNFGEPVCCLFLVDWRHNKALHRCHTTLISIVPIA